MEVEEVVPETGDFEGIKKRKLMSLDEIEPEDQAKSSDLQVVEESSPPTNSPDQDKDTPDMDTSSSDFAALLQLPSYVDQTLVIGRIQCGPSVTLITAPKGWGKSIAISTLKHFYELEVKPNGEKVTNVNFPRNTGKMIPEDNTIIEDTPNYELFKESELARKRPNEMKHLGKYPVIWLKFKGSVNNSKDALTNCLDAIQAAYRQHSYLENSPMLAKCNDESIECFKEWCDDESIRNMGWNDVDTSIQDLSRYLCIHWERKCVILIDDYDAITMSCLKSEFITLDEFDTIQTHLVNMLLYAFKGNNEHMKKGFITGRTYVLSLWSSVNNVRARRFAGKFYYTKFCSLNGHDVWENNEIPWSNEKLKHFSV